MPYFKIDLHMHTEVSDGTDSPEDIIRLVRETGIDLFSVTDHDATDGCLVICDKLKKGDPDFIFGVEFSCQDEAGKYHILGYGYDPDAPSIRNLEAIGHGFRIGKTEKRFAFLEKEFGFSFSDEDRAAIMALDNPGKPHLANMMVKYGYAGSKEEAILKYLNLFDGRQEHVRPEDAISAIADANGISVLAHPSFGSGEEFITGEQMEQRLIKLIGFGLRGVEAYYSGMGSALRREMEAFADRFGLYVTAGSDYHGSNKQVRLGQTNLEKEKDYPAGLVRFLNDVRVFHPLE